MNRLPFCFLPLFFLVKFSFSQNKDTIWLKDGFKVTKNLADHYLAPTRDSSGISIFTGYWTNGNPYIQGRISNAKQKPGGHKFGSLTTYLENGSIEKNIEYRDSVAIEKDGEGNLVSRSDGVYLTEYYPNGQIARKILLAIQINKDQNWSRSMWDLQKDGVLNKNQDPEIELFYENGARATIVDMKKRAWVDFYPSGDTAYRLIKNQDGFTAKTFHRNGRLYQTEVLDNQFRPSGPYKVFFPNGHPSKKGTRKKTELETMNTGDYYEYYPNGKVFLYRKYAPKKVKEIDESKMPTVKELDAPQAAEPPPVYHYVEKQVPVLTRVYYANGSLAKTFQGENIDYGWINRFEQNEYSKMMFDSLQPEEKKYPFLDRKRLTGDRGFSNQEQIYQVDGKPLDGQFLDSNSRQITIYSFTNGKLSDQKTEISSYEDIGIYRLSQVYHGLEKYRRSAVQVKGYDDGFYFEEDKPGKWEMQENWQFRKLSDKKINDQYPDITFEIIAYLPELLKSPVRYSPLFPTYHINYQKGKEKEYKWLEESVTRNLER